MNPAMDPGIAGMRNLLQVAYLHTNIPAGDNFPPRRRRLAAASRKAAASLPLAPVRVHPLTVPPSRIRSPTHSPTPVARVELARSERCGPVQTVAPGCTGG